MTASLRPHHIALKTTRVCNAHCYHCEDRQSYYGPMDKRHRELSLPVAEEIIAHFAANGLEKVTLTGGEPTLCNELSAMVRMARKYVDRVTVITNGWTNNPSQWEEWLADGVTDVDISVDGQSGVLHDWLRNRPGLFKRIDELIHVLSRARANGSLQRLSVVTLVSGFNILRLDQLLAQILSWGVDRWVLHYPESDLDGVFSPSLEKQARYRSDVLPKLTDMLVEALPAGRARTDALAAMSRLYDPENLPTAQAAEGVYHPSLESARTCNIPGSSLLVKYDGSLHGCLGGDYSDDARIASPDQGSGLHIDDKAFERLVRDRIAYCRHCPVPLTLRVPLRVD